MANEKEERGEDTGESIMLIDKDGNEIPVPPMPKKKNVTLHIYLPEDGGDEAMA